MEPKPDQLADQDFFELSSHDVDMMGLVDRLNIHYKIGKFENVSFEKDELYFVDKAFKTETFDEVLVLAEELYQFIKKQEEMMTKVDTLEFSTGDQGGSGMGGGSGEMEIPSGQTDQDGEDSDNDAEAQT